MSHELWATYSVNDHLQPRALAADIMLFDRLVFPVPQDGRFPENTGSPIESGPVEWRPNAAEWKRWEEEGWEPAAQQRLLDILQPVSRKLSWNSAAPEHEKYRSEATRLAAQGLPDYAFVATRTLLTRDLPAYVTGVATIGPAYRSVEQIERELGIGRADARKILPGGALSAVLAWEFFSPDSDDEQLSPTELLRETVEFVTGDSGFRKRRTAFIEWQQKFLREGVTDRDSIEHAVAEMHDLLDDVRSATKRLKVRKTARYAFQIAPSVVGLGAAIAGIPGGVEIAALGAFLSIGSITVDEAVFKSAEQGQPAPAAFVHDARRHFGWKPKR